jgi:predicted ATPase
MAELLRDMQVRGDVLQDGNGLWSARDAIAWTAMPSRVEGVIDLHLSRLTPEQRTALEIASVQGETFTAEPIAYVQQADVRSLIEMLSSQLGRQLKLVQAEGVVHVAGRRLSTYRFRHHLFQQYLYYQLDDVERAFRHEDVAIALATLYGDESGHIAAQLAHHHEAASNLMLAAQYRLQAGMEAFKFSANIEAAEHFSHGLEFIPLLPSNSEKVSLELGLRAGYAGALLGSRGFFDYGVSEAVERAQELAEIVGPRPETLPVYFNLVVYYFNTHLQYAAAHPGGPLPS